MKVILFSSAILQYNQLQNEHSGELEESSMSLTPHPNAISRCPKEFRPIDWH